MSEERKDEESRADEEATARPTARERRAVQARRSRRSRVIAGIAFVMVVLAICVGATVATGGSDSDVPESPSEQVATDANAPDDSDAPADDSAASSEEGRADADGDAASGAPASAVEMQTVTDSEGRSVDVPADPQSIAVFDSFSGELVVMIGAGPRACGMPAGVMSDTILQMIYPELTTAPVSLSGNTVNVETLAAQSCDVALVKSTLSDEERAKLDRFGIPYVVVDYVTVEEQIEAVRLVGTVCAGEAAERAEALAGYYEGILDLVRTRAELVDEADRVSVYHSINTALLTDSEDSLGRDWVELAGCGCASASSQATSGTDYTATLEQIYNWDPDVVICNVATTADEIAADPQWSGISAVTSGRVYNIPIGATRWGQRGSVETYLAMLWLGCTVYPDIYQDVDFKQEVVGYYRDYLGIGVDDQLWGQIVSGEGIRSSGSGDGTGGSGS